MQRAAEIVGADVIGIIFRKQVRLAGSSSFGICQEAGNCRFVANGSNRPKAVGRLRARDARFAVAQGARWRDLDP